MPPPIDLTGHKYTRLTVLHEVLPAVYPRRWICKCDCGEIKDIIGASLRSGLTQSCGCLNKERVSSTNTKHGQHKTRLYKIWLKMKRRCTVIEDPAYSYYGALGIRVCNEWQEFLPFKEWADTNGYSVDLSIDRIDGSQDYCPTNCRWADATIQARNQKVRNTNTSGYTGVCFNPTLNKYESYITIKYKKINLGYFVTKEAAFEARNNYIIANKLLGFPTNRWE